MSDTATTQTVPAQSEDENRAAATRERVSSNGGSDVPGGYFGGSGSPALLTREQEVAIGTRLVAARRAILALLGRAPQLMDAAIPKEDRGAVSPAEDFRERETLLVLERAKKSLARPKPPAYDFASAEELGRYTEELNEAVERYRVERDTIIESNIRLVLSLARRYKRNGVPFLDLVQEGVLGLIRAVEKFDPVRDVRFGTYAVWWIWQQIGRAGDLHSALIRTPIHWNQLRRKLAREVQRLEAEGIELEREQLAEASGIDRERLDVMTQTFQCLSLASPVGSGDDRALEEVLASESADPEEDAASSDLSVQLETALDALPSREAAILRLRFGTTEERSLTLEEVGKRYGVSRERVRQIEARALKLLLPICERQGLRAYFD